MVALNLKCDILKDGFEHGGYVWLYGNRKIVKIFLRILKN